jgi:hypothetical protein
MVQVVKAQTLAKRKHPTKGSPAKRCLEDQLLMLLMYYREYRTFLHTATTYGYSEAQAFRIIRRLEELLIQSKAFHLPGKKALLRLESGLLGKIMVVDVGECPVERPKKNSGATILAKRENIP